MSTLAPPVEAAGARARAGGAGARGVRAHDAARRPLRLTVIAGAVVGYAAWAAWVAATRDVDLVTASTLVAAAAYAAGALLAWAQRPDQRFGLLLLLTAACFVLPTLQATRLPVLWTAGTVLDSLFAPLLVYLVLRFPRERLIARVDRVLVASVLVVPLVFAPAITALLDPSRAGCADCPPGLNLLLVEHRPDLAGPAVEALFWYIAVNAALIAARLLWRLRTATAPALRMLAPVLVPAAAWFLLHAATRVVRLEVTDEVLRYGPTVAASTVLLSVIPFGVTVGLLRARARRSRIGDLVVELGRLPTSERLRDAVARTLGDPGAQVGFWVPRSGRYVTAEGERLDLPVPGGPREVTHVEGRGEPLAVIVHDAALRDEPALIDAVGAAARFAVENERLRAETLARLEEVRESRARIVHAGDEERRRIERNLHDGAQQRLVALTLQLRLLAERPGAEAVRPAIGAAADELGEALAELRELAQGLHPAVLEDEGLAGAVEFLAERAPAPVEVEVPSRRFDETCEATAYFVVAEALANVAKHAPGAGAAVRIAEVGGTLDVEVRDDGPGGATPDDGGSGLRGLADRVAAAGGRLEVVSPAGGGTTLKARLPCG